MNEKNEYFNWDEGDMTIIGCNHSDVTNRDTEGEPRDAGGKWTSEAGAKEYAEREKDERGYLKPKHGDEVHTVLPGIFGMPQRLDGVVTGSKVKITGGATNRKLAKLTDAPWRVNDDPNIEKQAAISKAKSDADAKAKKESDAAEKQARESAVDSSVRQAVESGHREYKPSEVKAGQTITAHFGTFEKPFVRTQELTVHSAHEKWPDFKSAPDETPWTIGNARITGKP